MIYRTLGSTGEKVSAIGVGGWHLSLKHVDEDLSLRIVRTAIDRGINFMDNCWDYNDGERLERAYLVDLPRPSRGASPSSINKQISGRCNTCHSDLLLAMSAGQSLATNLQPKNYESSGLNMRDADSCI